MSTGSEQPVLPAQPVLPEGSYAMPRSERELLLQRIQELEDAQKRAEETIAQLELERDCYLGVAYKWVRSQITDEDIQRDAQMDGLVDGVPFETILEEFEKAAGIIQDG